MRKVRKTAVVGMGIMGPDIALGFALGGCGVMAYARRPESLEDAGKRVASNMEQLVRENLVRAEAADTITARIIYTSDLEEALEQADYVTEAVSENIAVKQNIFKQCGDICDGDVVITSNTSSISIDEIAGNMKHPERAIVTHWFIPAHLMPVIEVVPGSRTSDATVQATRDLLKGIGKRPAVCRENPAFVHNFIQAAMSRAALMLVEEGICEPEDVDAIVQNGFALRLAAIGPVRMVDYAGLDTALSLMKYVYGKTGNPWFKPPEILVEKVEKGELGMKSGKGFYTYAQGEVDRIRKIADETVIGVKKALFIK